MSRERRSTASTLPTKLRKNLPLNITEEEWKIFVDSPFADHPFLITICQKSGYENISVGKICCLLNLILHTFDKYFSLNGVVFLSKSLLFFICSLIKFLKMTFS